MDNVSMSDLKLPEIEYSIIVTTISLIIMVGYIKHTKDCLSSDE